ncbi:MAG TPA: LrgB family protein [Microvirga sp.]|jgi:predicted murein hydrolase (TIGR00659 family)|nr:LrgB family protein [Microvirga sp.]
MSEPGFALWVYLSRTPLLWLTVTLVAYVIADRVSAATGRHPLANPVLHSVWLIAGVLALSGTPYRTYFDGAQFVHFLLGPATVALAVPLYENRAVVLRSLGPMLLALAVGSVTALVSALAIAQAFGMPPSVLASLAPKSVTAAVAMGIAERLGGDAALTAVIVILTGIIGAVVVTPLMDALRIRDWRARGFAAGLAAHGIGTARAFQVHPLAGTFAGIAMGLNALLTAVVVPVAIGWFA